MGHALAVARAGFDAQPKSERAMVPPDHDRADRFQERPASRAWHEAFGNGWGSKGIHG
jgi:hypothetical protein